MGSLNDNEYIYSYIVCLLVYFEAESSYAVVADLGL